MKYFKFTTPAQKQASEFKSDFGLEHHGFKHLETVYWNLPVAALYEEAIIRNEGKLVQGGAFVVHTGKWTARAADDKYIVKEPSTEDMVDWGEYNRPITEEKFNSIYARLLAFLQGEEVFVQDVFAGADPDYKLNVRVITDTAWQSFFAHNMFNVYEDRSAHRNFVPEFTVIAAPAFNVDPRIDGTRSETAIIINFAQRIAIIAGSKYAGEVKKSVFTIMNFLLPLQDVLAMHCSANVGVKGDVALFFGLSGTGKTTLSADPTRNLIGDDEHGWSDDSVFNFEAGCYAKVVRLSPSAEPEIYACTHRFGSILENVMFDESSRFIDLDDNKLTENTRISYPIDFIPNAVPEKMAYTQPQNIVFLTADAQGVLPPIARLTLDQAIYHFMSGYTSKIAGTELGLGIEPEMTFSACFGAPFMVHFPYYYAKILKSKAARSGTKIWLVNTGWVGGKFGVGKRISIKHTRRMLNAAIEGELDQVTYRQDEIFGFEVPLTCPGIDDDVFTPEAAWGNKEEYWQKYDALAARYIENFKKFKGQVPDDIVLSGPKRFHK